jgi:CheY-like chemotaxis protein
MFKSQNEQVTVLGVCVEEPAMVGRVEGLDFCSVRSARRAIDMMRMLSFDLLLVGMRLPDVGTWDFVRRVRTGSPWQKWGLVGGGVGGLITDDQERSARMFGSVRIYDVMPSSDEILTLASALREKAAKAVLNQTFDRPLAAMPRMPAPTGFEGYRPAAGF